jgi:hypothetical protein
MGKKGYKQTEEHKRKLSLIRKGRKHINPNCKCCSCKAKRGEYKGKFHPQFGTHPKEETLKKMSEIKIGLYLGEN